MIRFIQRHDLELLIMTMIVYKITKNKNVEIIIILLTLIGCDLIHITLIISQIYLLMSYTNTPMRNQLMCLISIICNIVQGYLAISLLLIMFFLQLHEIPVLPIIDSRGQSLIMDSLNKYLDQIKDVETKQVFWVSAFATKNVFDDTIDDPNLRRWVENYSSKIIEFKGKLIDGYGFIVNPPDSLPQDWHIDYTRNYTTIFIPLINCNSNNMTQVLSESYYLNLLRKGFNLSEADFVNDRPMITNQIITKQYQPILLSPCLFHRGISNGTNENRSLFWLSYKLHDDVVDVEGKTQEFTKQSIGL